MKRIIALVFVVAVLVSAVFVPVAGAVPGNGNGPRGNPQSCGSNGLGPFDNPGNRDRPMSPGLMLGVPVPICI
jgi:hypothetical protein